MAHEARHHAQASSGRETLPEAPRPRPEVWRALRDEGITWEGQVLLVGEGLDLPALLVLTPERVAIICNGDIVLEAPRSWITPEPRLLSGTGVRLSITPLGDTPGRDSTNQILLEVRGGRGTAAKLVGAITGRLVSARVDRPVRRTTDEPAWAERVGAAPPLALPPLPDAPADPVPARGSWPPVEQKGLTPRAPERPAPGRKTEASGSISAWTAANLDASPAGPARDFTPVAGLPDPNQKPAPTRRRRALTWGFRALVLALLLGAGATYGQDYLPRNLDIPLPAKLEERLGLADNDGEPTDLAQAPVGETPEATNPDSDGTSGPNNSDLVGTRDDDGNDGNDGLGGPSGEITPANIGNGMLDTPPSTAPATEEPVTEEPVVEVTEEPASEPVNEGADESTSEPSIIEPTLEPTEEVVEPEPTDTPPTEEPATEVPTDVPATEAPTEEPVTEVPATEEPTDVPVTEDPTDEPATEAPTELPATEAPTEEPATEEPTEAPATETPAATLESQPPSVDPANPPAQSLAAGAFRYEITSASRGETIESLPDLQPVGGYGEWVVVTVSGQNVSDTEQVFDMSQFRILADGKEFTLDVGNAWVGGLLGYTPAYGNTDAILWAGGEGHEFALTFLVPTGTESLHLVAGDQVIDLGSTLEDDSAVGTAGTTPSQPEAIEATVVEVIDAETLVIEKDGITQTVRYIGIDVPTGDDCLASEATAANAALVAGKTVRIERQSTDLDARGNWVRDVWVPADDGSYILASHALVQAGLAEASPSEPNTRFAGWLTGAQAAAQAEGAGIWGVCGDEGSTPTGQQAVGPHDRRTVSAWRASRHRNA